jgi:ABC-type polysaccharide/polyol phosphate export permease
MKKFIDILKLSQLLGWQDVKQAYRRSAIGPFWITGGMAVQIATMGFVFGLIFKIHLQDYLPFLASSIVIWGLVSTSLNEGALSFISAESLIRQLPLSPFVHLLRVLWKNLITFAHNFVILPIVFLAVWHPINWTIVLLIPGLVLLAVNLLWFSVVLGVLSTRYRDAPPILASLVTIAFYVTPVMWLPNLIGNNQVAHSLLGFNPLYHLIQIVRLPLLGNVPTPENWYLSTLLAIVGWGLSTVVMRKYKNKIAYWV